MGIPCLAGHLQPYSVPSTLGSTTKTRIGSSAKSHTVSSKVIVDGPGLAYHIYYKLLAANCSSLNVFDAQLSYVEIGEAILAYLEVLEQHQLVITHIFFDGALPKHKRPTRISRLESSLKDLIKLQNQYPNGFPVSLPNSTKPKLSLPETVFNPSHPLPPSHRLLPAPPFLIPAILDALAKSKYASLTTVVPGEADPYCARAARDEGGMILTGDSDLLVYDTGSHGSVVFLNQIEPCVENSESNIRTNVFSPSSIAANLKLPSLQRLAYEIKTNPTISFSEALHRTKQDIIDLSLFDLFLEEYVLPPLSPSSSPPPDPQIPIPRALLDPRLSELIHQLTSPSSYPKDEEPQISLPFLLDDPSRTSAWEVSVEIRQFCYSLLVTHVSRTSDSASTSQDKPKRKKRIGYNSVTEISRKGYRITSTPIPLLPLSSPSTETSPHQTPTSPPPPPPPVSHNPSFITLLSKTLSTFRFLPHKQQVHIFALTLINTHLIQNGKPTPSKLALRRALTFSPPKAIKSWQDIHIHAQICGVLYAMRMLGQVLKYLEGCGLEIMGKDGRGDFRGWGLEDAPCLGYDGFGDRGRWGEGEGVRGVGVEVEDMVTFVINGGISGERREVEDGLPVQRDDIGGEKGEGFQHPKKTRRGVKKKGGDMTGQRGRKEVIGKGNMYDVLSEEG